jgi:hypothetical protein
VHGETRPYKAISHKSNIANKKSFGEPRSGNLTGNGSILAHFLYFDKTKAGLLSLCLYAYLPSIVTSQRLFKDIFGGNE